MKFNDKLTTLLKKGSTNFCVTPQHEMIISCHVKSNQWVSGLTTGLVEPLVSVTEKTVLAVVKSLVKVGDGAIPVRVAHFGPSVWSLFPVKVG